MNYKKYQKENRLFWFRHDVKCWSWYGIHQLEKIIFWAVVIGIPLYLLGRGEYFNMVNGL